ncbi:MAG: hypothetical protein KJ579_02150 [Verrucomicrobia bacterium]|nr:hypothetical protein [Verrucomicrobiota bacterium]
MDGKNLPQVVAEIPWGHNRILLIRKPVGVAAWRTKLVKALPKELKGPLPAVAEIEKELGDGR